MPVNKQFPKYEGYCRFPNKIAQNAELNPFEKAVLLCGLSKEEKHQFTRDELKEALGVSYGTIDKTIKTLTKKGYCTGGFSKSGVSDLTFYAWPVACKAALEDAPVEQVTAKQNPDNSGDCNSAADTSIDTKERKIKGIDEPLDGLVGSEVIIKVWNKVFKPGTSRHLFKPEKDLREIDKEAIRSYLEQNGPEVDKNNLYKAFVALRYDCDFTWAIGPALKNLGMLLGICKEKNGARWEKIIYEE